MELHDEKKKNNWTDHNKVLPWSSNEKSCLKKDTKTEYDAGNHPHLIQPHQYTHSLQLHECSYYKRETVIVSHVCVCMLSFISATNKNSVELSLDKNIKVQDKTLVMDFMAI